MSYINPNENNIFNIYFLQLISTQFSVGQRGILNFASCFAGCLGDSETQYAVKVLTMDLA